MWVLPLLWRNVRLTKKARREEENRECSSLFGTVGNEGMQGALRKKVPFCGKYVQAAGGRTGSAVWALLSTSLSRIPFTICILAKPELLGLLEGRVPWVRSLLKEVTYIVIHLW